VGDGGGFWAMVDACWGGTGGLLSPVTCGGQR